AVQDRIATGRPRLEALEAEAAQDAGEGAEGSRLAVLIRELEELDRARSAELDEQLTGLEGERHEAEGALERAEAEVAARREAVVAAGLGGHLAAAVVEDRPGGAVLLDRAGEEGGSVLVAGGQAADEAPTGASPTADAERLRDRVAGPGAALALLADAWVVER